MDDISKFAKVIDNIRSEYNYDAGKVIKEFSDLELLRTNHASLQMSVNSLQGNIGKLEQEQSIYQALVNMHRQTMSKYKDLEAMRLGLKELSFLWDTLNEIAFANEIPVEKAVKKFLTDGEEQYDKKIGFNLKLRDCELRSIA